MKIILTHEVSGLGAAGDVVEVKDGYGRNYLLPKGLALPWTKGGQKQVDSINRARQSRAVKSLEQAQSAKGTLENTKVTLPARAGDNGRLFGGVTTAEIAEAVQASGGGSIDRRTVEVPSPIRTTGEHTVTVRLHPEVLATVTLNVVPAK